MAKQTNEQKYKTAEERVEAFRAWRKEKCGDLAKGCKGCEGCEIRRVCDGNDAKFAHWLLLEAEEEKPENCPFCGKEVVVGFSENIHREKYRQVWCSDGERCGYECVMKKTEADAVAAHNRVCRAVRAAGNEKGE